MVKTVTAIIRHSLAEHPRLLPGHRCLMRRDMMAKSAETPVHIMMVGSPSTTFCVPRGVCLPVPLAFKQQPTNNFWFLINKKAFHAGEANHYLSKWKSKTLGTTPFRFESEGAVLDYMRVCNMPFTKYYVCEATYRVRKPEIKNKWKMKMNN